MPDKYLEAVWNLEQRGEKPTVRDVAAATGMAYTTTVAKLTHHTRAGLVTRKRQQRGKAYTYGVTPKGLDALQSAPAAVVPRWVRYDLRKGVPEIAPWTAYVLHSNWPMRFAGFTQESDIFEPDPSAWTHVDILEGMPPLLPPPDYEAERIAARVAELEAQLAAARAELADLRGSK